jgi:DNA-binding NarL/FixJ family response regulator
MPEKKYRIIVVDDHEVFRMGLKLLLEKVSDVEVVNEASNGKEFLALLGQDTPDIVFMDINMPVLDGVEATKIALQRNPDLKIIALTTFGELEYFDKMIFAGVEGFMLKNAGFDDFRTAIEKVGKGGNYFSAELLMNFRRDVVSERIRQKKELPNFTEREMEVLELICKGYSNNKIGEKLFISNRTVERHKSNLINKTETNNTINLILFAIRHKLVQLDNL